MTAFMLFLGFLCLVLLICLSALKPARSTLSSFELQRRKALGDSQAAEALRREELLVKAAALGPFLMGILCIVLAAALVSALDWGRGIAGAVVVMLLYPRIAHFSPVKKLVSKLEERYEAQVLNSVEKYPVIIGIFGGKPVRRVHAPVFASRQELLHTIEASHVLFSEDDKKLMKGAISLKERTVGELMTAREDIVTIQHDELLGPLVLSDLYKTGHSSFPVVTGDIDHVVGLLDIRNLLTLESEFSAVAARAMTPDMLTIAASETLHGAMLFFLRSGQQLALVTNEENVTIGLISLNDILGVLFGRR